MVNRSYYRLDIITATLIGLISFLHWLAWSSYPPDADPINFMVALHTYNISADAPHPPGYPLFVFLGRLSSIIVGNQHAYQFVNLALLMGAGFCLYWLFRQLDYQKIGLSATVLLISHPLTWSATVIPESYISDTLLGCVTITWIVIMRHRYKRLIIGIPLIFFIFGLFRPISCFLLLPLAVGGVILIAVDHKKLSGILTAIGGLSAVVLAYGLTILLGGGIQVYRAAVDRVMGNAVRGASIFAGASVSAHAAMILKLIVWSLFLAAPVIFVLSACFVFKGSSFLVKPYLNKALKIGLLWILPPYTFYALVYYLKPTYQLIYLPAFLIVLAWLIQEGLPNLRQLIKWFIISSIVIAQLLFFFFAPSALPSQLYSLSHGYFIQQDAAWNQLLKGLNPLRQENTLLIWIDHPNLTVYALRLLDWPEPSAVSNEDRSKLLYVLPSTMTWIPSSMEDFTISDKYEKAVLIYNSNGLASIKSVRLDDLKMRQVSNLLNLAKTTTK